MATGLTKTTEINYDPHYNVLTKSGKAHFSNFKDAVCELLDNSIQATVSNIDSRELKLIISFGVAAGSSYLVIYDNGCGMDQQGVTAFATFFLSQRDRGLAPPEDANAVDAGGSRQPGGGGSTGRIGKFGVGALQAGFYMGSSLSIVTRSRENPPSKDDESVHEFTMDEDKFASREAGSVFKDTIVERPPHSKTSDCSSSDDFQADDDSSTLEKLVLEHGLEDHKGHSFTYVALRLRNDQESFLKHSPAEMKLLARQLAHTYHYYLHPSSPSPASALTSSSSSSSSGPTSLPVSIELKAKGQATGLGTGVLNYARNWEVERLEELPNLEQRFVTSAARVFNFDLALAHDDDEGNEITHVVRGEVRYYPHNGQRETIPERCYDPQPSDFEEGDDHDAEAGVSDDSATLTQASGLTQAGLTQSGAGSGGGTRLSGSGTGKGVSSGTMDVFWCHRLVPESSLDSLPFWPSKEWENTHRDELGPDWKNRLHGSLFFQWHFPISVNKLRLLPRGGVGLSELIANEDLTEWTPRLQNCKKSFGDFLIKCHSELDKDMIYHDPDTSAPQAAQRQVFKALTFGALPTTASAATGGAQGRGGGGGTTATFRVGDKVRLWKGSSTVRGKGLVLGEIAKFIVKPPSLQHQGSSSSSMFFLQPQQLPSPLPSTWTWQGGNGGSVVVKRFPESVFGLDCEFECDSSRLHPQKSLVSDKKDWQEEIALKEKDLPAKLRVKHVSKRQQEGTSNTKHATRVGDGSSLGEKDTTEISAGEQQITLVVCVENGAGKVVTKQPERGSGGVGSSEQWHVSLTLFQDLGGGVKEPIFRHVSSSTRRCDPTSSSTHPSESSAAKVGSKSRAKQGGGSSGDNGYDMAHFFEPFDIYNAGRYEVAIQVLRSGSGSHNQQTSDNVVLEWTHYVNVTPAAAKTIEASWVGVTSDSGPPSTPFVRLGNALPKLKIILRDEFSNDVGRHLLKACEVGGEVLVGKQSAKTNKNKKGKGAAAAATAQSTSFRDGSVCPLSVASIQLNMATMTSDSNEGGSSGSLGPLSLCYSLPSPSSSSSLSSSHPSSSTGGDETAETATAPLVVIANPEAGEDANQQADIDSGDDANVAFGCGDGDWTVMPKFSLYERETGNTDFLLFERNDGVLSVEVRIVLTLRTNNIAENDIDFNDDFHSFKFGGAKLSAPSKESEILLECAVPLFLLPGSPSSLSCDAVDAIVSASGASSSQLISPVQVTDGGKLPSLLFRPSDRWGYRTFSIAFARKSTNPAAATVAASKKKKGKKQELSVEIDPLDDPEHWKVSLSLQVADSSILPHGDTCGVVGNLSGVTGEGDLLSSPVDLESRAAVFKGVSLTLPQGSWTSAAAHERRKSGSGSLSQNEAPLPIPQTLVAQLRTEEEEIPGATIRVPLEVLPDNAPRGLEVWRRDAETDEATPYEAVEATAGSTLADLEVRIIGIFGQTMNVRDLMRRNLEKCPIVTSSSSRRKKDVDVEEEDENRDGMPFQGIKMVQVVARTASGNDASSSLVRDERYRHGWRQIIEDEESEGAGGASEPNVLGADDSILLPDFELEKELPAVTSLEVTFSIEVHFAPHLKWAPLKQDISFPLVPGPPKRWQISMCSSNVSSSSSSSSSSSKGEKATLQCGDSVAIAAPHVFLVDEFKNHILDSRWDQVLIDHGACKGPLVTFEARGGGLDDGEDSGVLAVPTVYKRVDSKQKRSSQDHQHTEGGVWCLDPNILARGSPGKAKLKVCSNLKPRDQGEDQEQDSDDSMLSALMQCKEASKSVTLVSGAPQAIEMRSIALAGCEVWGTKLVAGGEIQAGYSLEDLDLKLVDASGNDARLGVGETVVLKVDRGSMGVIETTLSHQDQAESTQGSPCFNFPPLILVKPPASSSTSNKKTEKKKKSKKGKKKRKAADLDDSDNDGDEIDGDGNGGKGPETLVKVQATWFAAADPDNEVENEGVALSPAVLQGCVLSVDKVSNLHASFHPQNRHAAGNLFGAAYAEGEAVLVIPSSVPPKDADSAASSTSSVVGVPFPSILVRLLGEDGQPSPSIEPEELCTGSANTPPMLQLECQFNSSNAGNRGGKKRSEEVAGTHGGGEASDDSHGGLVVKFPATPFSNVVAEEEEEGDGEDGGEDKSLKVGEYVFSVTFTETRRTVLAAFKGLLASQQPTLTQRGAAPKAKTNTSRRGQRGSSSSSSSSSSTAAATLYGDGGSQLDDSEVSLVRAFTVRVCPGAPAAVEAGKGSAGRASSLGLLQRLTCSDRADDDDARTLLENCVLSVVDGGGNACTTESLRVRKGQYPQPDGNEDEDEGGGSGEQLSVRCRVISAANEDDEDGGGGGGGKPSGGDGASEVPLLEGCDEGGWVLCDSSEWSESHGGNDHAFTLLRLQPATQTDADADADTDNATRYRDGHYRLLFEAVTLSSSLPRATGGDQEAADGSSATGLPAPGISPFEVSFELSTDAARVAAERERQKEVARLEALLDPLQSDREELRVKMQTAQKRASEAESEARAAAGKVPPSYRRRLLSSRPQARGSEDEEQEDESQQPLRGVLPSAVDAARWLQQWRKDLQVMNSVVPPHDAASASSASAAVAAAAAGGGLSQVQGLPGQRRPALINKMAAKPEFSAQVEALRPRGRLVELAFLEDDRVAFVVSWMLQSRMQVVVVNTTDDSKTCRSLEAKSAAIDPYVPYQVKLPGGLRRERTEEEKALKVLPGLPSLASVPGNPRYLINEFQLLERDEDLRDTLLAKIVGPNTLLFDHLDGCNEYRNFLKARKQQHGLLICLDEGGVKIMNDGILGPSSDSADGFAAKNKTRGKSMLDFMFGSLPAGETADGRLLEAACEAASECVECVEEHESADQELQAVEAEVGGKADELDAEIRGLEQELRKVQRDGGDGEDEDGGGGKGVRGGRKSAKGGKRKKARR